MKQDKQANAKQAESTPVAPPARAEETEQEVQEETIRKPYRNPWLLLLALGALPATGYAVASWAGIVVGFLLGFALIAAYPPLRGK